MISARSTGCRRRLAVRAALVLMGLTSGCIGSPNGAGSGSAQNDATAAASDSGDSSSLVALRNFPLDTLATSTVTIADDTFRVWLAISSDETQEGLMYVPAEDIADDQGMLFVFDGDGFRSFWMKNTVTPLDIAFIGSDGTIVKTHTMPALTLQTFPSIEPARFALEVKAGTFAKLGIRAGDRVDIPADVFKANP